MEKNEIIALLMSNFFEDQNEECTRLCCVNKTTDGTHITINKFLELKLHFSQHQQNPTCMHKCIKTGHLENQYKIINRQKSTFFIFVFLELERHSFVIKNAPGNVVTYTSRTTKQIANANIHPLKITLTKYL